MDDLCTHKEMEELRDEIRSLTRAVLTVANVLLAEAIPRSSGLEVTMMNSREAIQNAHTRIKDK